MKKCIRVPGHSFLLANFLGSVCDHVGCTRHILHTLAVGFISSLATPFISSLATPFISSLATPFISSLATPFISSLATPLQHQQHSLYRMLRQPVNYRAGNSAILDLARWHCNLQVATCQVTWRPRGEVAWWPGGQVTGWPGDRVARWPGGKVVRCSGGRVFR
jgi:hypothetical protein